MPDNTAHSARLLGIETATDACSVALQIDGHLDQRHECNPRQHSRRLFPMLAELLNQRAPACLGLNAIVYGCGPGSFTGLRIAASAAQGLAFSLDLPVVPVSTLACQAATARRKNAVPRGAAILSLLDANIGQVYWALYRVGVEGLEALMPPAVCVPEALPVAVIVEQLAESVPLYHAGSGTTLVDAVPGLPAAARYAAILPEARDLLPLARVSLADGAAQSATDVSPVYVQDATRWKKLEEQGPRP